MIIKLILNNPPILANSGSVMINVSNIILRLLADLIKRIILIILKLRSTDIAVPTLVNRFICSKIAPIAVKITTTKSKTLKVSLK